MSDIATALSVSPLLAVLLALLVWLSFRLGQRAEQRELETERHELDAGWTALEQARQVNDVFFHARAAMRQAERRGRG